jgi:two-component system OmpR family response regulator
MTQLVTLDQAKLHLRVDQDAEDDDITLKIEAASAAILDYIGDAQYLFLYTGGDELDLEATTEFLVLIAALLELKSRLMLPGEDGMSIARRLRQSGNMPILMLTARGEEIDRIVGLEVGADDYMAKPFSPRELLARIRAVLRRTGERGDEAPKPRNFRFAGWRVDALRRELYRPDGAMIPTTDAEFDLLAAFLERPQRVLSREQLLDLARGRTAQLFDRSIDVAVMRLRRKIEPDPTKPEIIRTVRNGGYMFAADVEILT